MLKGHKRTKKLAVAVAATAILTLGMTSAYLEDASENITNYFDPEWVKVDMQESGDQQYDIIPGTEEKKDPKVKVNNSVDAYVYLVVTDNVNAGRENNPLVTYSLDSKWTEISKADLEGKTIYDSEGNEVTLGDNDKLYYQVAPKTATGEGDEDKDDYEITYPVLVGDKVSYSTDITNEDLEILEKDGVQNILKFVAYAIQKDPFTDPVSALCHEAGEADDDTALADAKAAVKAALLEKLNSYGPEGDNEHGNDAQNQAYADAIAAVDNATTADDVDNAKTAGITAIEEAATSTVPTIADINKQLKEQGETFEITELAGYKNWNDATAYAAEKGGRLATVAELKAIYNIEKDMSPRPIYSEMTGYMFAWSSEEYPSITNNARLVGFGNGRDYYFNKALTNFVVVVRDLA